jgi:glycosyltransferase involved in cell wall biosynthesis
MFWEPWDYFEREEFISYRTLKRAFWFFAAPLLSLLRLWDCSAAQRVDYFMANSKTPQNRIKKYYRRDSTIIYPFADSVYSEGVETKEYGDATSRQPYYLVITRLQPWKRVDIAVEACKKMGIRLKIIGVGSDENRLKKMSDEHVEFMGYVSEEEKYRALENSHALIITQKEDFGITALEAMSAGKPVIAYKAGGVLETVINGVTGEFFEEQTADSLSQVLLNFNPSNYKSEDCKTRAAKFSKQKFMQELDEFVKNVYHKKTNLP